MGNKFFLSLPIFKVKATKIILLHNQHIGQQNFHFVAGTTIIDNKFHFYCTKQTFCTTNLVFVVELYILATTFFWVA